MARESGASQRHANIRQFRTQPLRRPAPAPHDGAAGANENGGPVARPAAHCVLDHGAAEATPKPVAGPPRRAGAQPYSLVWAFSRRAAPRMSPSEAPESEDPNFSMASFSSIISRALIETATRRAALSTLVTWASTRSPTA